ncbi:MAG TPA: AAA family ATPase [Burkholderiales bacterium]|nr:AAA family ATPase [Burkholderiales bacterium]
MVKPMTPETKPFLLTVELLRDRVESFTAYPFSLPVVRNLNKISLHPKITCFIGENGSGKSTLLEAIAVASGFNPEGGSRNFRFSTRESHSALAEYLRIAKTHRRPKDGFFLRAESFFNVATEIERLDAEPAPSPPIIDSFGGRSLHEQSHGESFLTLLIRRFRGEGLYILDEPEAALSPTRQLAALRRIHDLVEGGAQFIIATHSPILMSYPDAQIFGIDENGLSAVRLEETDHFLITKRFINNPEKMIGELFSS